MRDDANYLTQVREQYEDYPYPPRDPQDESKRLLWVDLTELAQLNHYCYRGRHDFTGYRTLVAGCGTGDAVIFLAQQLSALNGHVVALDLSQASMAVARERAELRGLSNITWLHGSLLDLPEMGLEPFDYINCAGVLHHLEDPDAGLFALKSVLKDDGVMGIMLYAASGCTGVYQMQELLRRVTQGQPEITRRIADSREILAQLPQNNWYQLGAEDYNQEVTRYGDVGLYDLLLHSQDRAYDVLAVYDYLERAGLHLAAFCSPLDRIKLVPELAITDAHLLKKIRRLSERDQQQVMELFHGSIYTHCVYVTQTAETVADVTDLNNVPYLYKFTADFSYPQMAEMLQRSGGKTFNLNERQQGGLVTYAIPPQRFGAAIFAQMDGQLSLSQIFDAVRQVSGKKQLSDAKLLADFVPLYNALNRVDHLLLRHPEAAPLPLV